MKCIFLFVSCCMMCCIRVFYFLFCVRLLRVRGPLFLIWNSCFNVGSWGVGDLGSRGVADGCSGVGESESVVNGVRASLGLWVPRFSALGFLLNPCVNLGSRGVGVSRGVGESGSRGVTTKLKHTPYPIHVLRAVCRISKPRVMST